MRDPDDDGLSLSTTSLINSFINFQYLRRMLPDESTTKAISSNVVHSGDAAGNFKQFLIQNVHESVQKMNIYMSS